MDICTEKGGEIEICVVRTIDKLRGRGFVSQAADAVRDLRVSGPDQLMLDHNAAGVAGLTS
jgi:hypothetical protein